MNIVRWTGVEVRALRLHGYRWTQVKMAAMTGFAVNTISNWERRGAGFMLTGIYAEAMDTLLEGLDQARAQRFQDALSDSVNVYSSTTSAGDPSTDPRTAAAVWDYGASVSGSIGADHSGGEDSMPISRRGFMAAVGVGAASTTAGPAYGFRADSSIDYVDHFRQLKRVLVDQDSLLGPRTVIPIVQQQIQVMSQLRRTAGTDASGLLRMQTNYAEFAGWLHHDSGDYVAAEYWTDRALQWSMVSGDAVMSSYILNRKAHLSGDTGDGGDTVALAAAAIRMAPPETPIGALANMRAAHGHALVGDRHAMEQAYDNALTELEKPDNNPDLPWAGWLTPSYIKVHRARSLNTLRDFRSAAQEFDDVLETLPRQYARDRAVYLVRAAWAHAGTAEIDHAAQLGLQALSIGQYTGSGRLAEECHQLGDLLAQWQTQSSVAEFRDALAAVASS